MYRKLKTSFFTVFCLVSSNKTLKAMQTAQPLNEAVIENWLKPITKKSVDSSDTIFLDIQRLQLDLVTAENDDNSHFEHKTTGHYLSITELIKKNDSSLRSLPSYLKKPRYFNFKDLLSQKTYINLVELWLICSENSKKKISPKAKPITDLVKSIIENNNKDLTLVELKTALETVKT
jgi:hypothetical protein